MSPDTDTKETTADSKRRRRSVRYKPAGQSQRERDLISLGRIESYMDSIIKGQMQCPTCQEEFPVKDITPAAAQLLRSRYDKLRPTLSAIEQVEPDRRDALRPDELQAKLMALFEKNPGLFESIQAARIRGAQATNAVQQSAIQLVASKDAA